jgi:hypothetical protein
MNPRIHLARLITTAQPRDWRPYKWGAIIGLGLFALSFVEAGLPGYAIFAAWAIQCGIAAARRDLVFWCLLTFVPLVFVAAGWPSTISAAEDPFGFKYATLMLFSGMCLVAAMTCMLALIGPFARRDSQ